ncbi:MAG: formyltransferase family protein [Nitrososphaera sp.]|jgi:methionyl-tRNA formyltransferase
MRTVIGFLSRQHGYNALLGLVDSPEYKIEAVFTHALKPKSQDPTRSKREDYDRFVETCSQNNIPLFAVDSKEQEISVPDCDYIIEISWRYLIPESIVKKARIASFGIHRGKLPEYAGAEPIKQALLKNEKEIILSAHYLDPKIDQGGTITTLSHPVNYDQNTSFENNVQRLRDEITPLFSKLMFKTLEIFEGKK